MSGRIAPTEAVNLLRREFSAMDAAARLTKAMHSKEKVAEPEVFPEKFEWPTINPGRHAGARIDHDHEEAKSNHC